MTTHQSTLARRISIARLVKARRETLGIRQTVLAKLIGVGPSIISEWERGRSGIPADKLDKIARMLACSPDDLRPVEANQT